MLTDKQAKNAKPKDKDYKLSDSKGLHLLVKKNGSKYWRAKYRFNGKEKTLAFGVYPEVPLKGYYREKGNEDSWVAGARDLLEESRRILASGRDPGQVRKAQKTGQRSCEGSSFVAIAKEWHASFEHTWSEGHGKTIKKRLERDVFPWIGDKPIDEIEAPELLSVLKRIEERGALETAHRVKSSCGQIFRYAIAKGKAKRDISADLKGALPQPIGTNLAAITDPQELSDLLQDIDLYKGAFVTRSALRLAPIFFLRPGELRKAEWGEFDLEQAEWNVPIERMKLSKKEKAKRSGDKHLVPLARQAIAILEELYPLTGKSKYVFPCIRSNTRTMSENTVNTALRKMGYSKEKVTGHGFRATARTMLDELLGFPADIIEHQLAHAVRDPNGRAYNRTKYIKQRRHMMQVWADYLDALRESEDAGKEFLKSVCAEA